MLDFWRFCVCDDVVQVRDIPVYEHALRLLRLFERSVGRNFSARTSRDDALVVMERAILVRVYKVSFWGNRDHGFLKMVAQPMRLVLRVPGRRVEI